MKKIIKLFVLFLSIATISSCALLESNSTIQFTKFPSAVYYVGDNVATAEADVEVKITPVISGKDTYTLAELNGISGFQFSGFDFTSIGTKVLTVTYDTVSISYTYQVLAKEDKQVPDTTWYNDTDTEFHLDTAAELRGLATLVNGGNHFEGKTVLLDANIDLGNVTWTPIGVGGRKIQGSDSKYYRLGEISGKKVGFLGTFDGQNHIINGLSNNGYSTIYDGETYTASNGFHLGGGYCYGLFGIIGDNTVESEVVIKNVKISKAIIHEASKKDGDLYYGVDSGAAILGHSFGLTTITILNCNVLSGDLYGIDAIAGIIGRHYAKTLKVYGCTNSATSYNSRDDKSGKAAGICGIVSTSKPNSSTQVYFQNCENKGTITGADGSLLGQILGGGGDGTVYYNNCTGTGDLTLFYGTKAISSDFALLGSSGNIL